MGRALPPSVQRRSLPLGTRPSPFPGCCGPPKRVLQEERGGRFGLAVDGPAGGGCGSAAHAAPAAEDGAAGLAVRVKGAPLVPNVAQALPQEILRPLTEELLTPVAALATLRESATTLDAVSARSPRAEFAGGRSVANQVGHSASWVSAS